VPDAIDGDGVIEVRIPRLNLQSGTFDLHASINNYQRTHIYDRWRFCLRFDVLDRHDHDSGGIVDLGGQWSPAVDGQFSESH
jgi:ABC-2 type transport system ATP-binding protein